MDIEVVLTESDPKLGKRGQVVKVSQGYAHNFLFPHNKAKLATAANLKNFEEARIKQEKELVQAKVAAKVWADKLNSLSLTIDARTGEGEKLYGAITSQEIQKVLAEQGIAVERKAIHLEEPIKKLGVYQIPVKLHSEVSATLKLWIVKQKS